MNLSRGGKAGQGGAGQGMTGHADQGGQEMWPVPATIPVTVVALLPTTIPPPVCPIQVGEGRYVKVKDHCTRLVKVNDQVWKCGQVSRKDKFLLGDLFGPLSPHPTGVDRRA